MSDSGPIVVDSSGWIEYLCDTPQAARFAPAIEAGGRLIVPTLCLHEVFKAILRQYDADAAHRAAALMRQAKTVPLDDEIAMLAAHLGLAEKLATADAIILATARAHRATLWTQDEHFAGKAGVKYFAKKAARPQG